MLLLLRIVVVGVCVCVCVCVCLRVWCDCVGGNSRARVLFTPCSGVRGGLPVCDRVGSVCVSVCVCGWSVVWLRVLCCCWITCICVAGRSTRLDCTIVGVFVRVVWLWG